MRFHNRQDAGRQLAAKLSTFAQRHDVVVLALPRGGVPVAFEVAEALGCPLQTAYSRLHAARKIVETAVEKERSLQLEGSAG